MRKRVRYCASQITVSLVDAGKIAVPMDGHVMSLPEDLPHFACTRAWGWKHGFKTHLEAVLACTGQEKLSSSTQAPAETAASSSSDTKDSALPAFMEWTPESIEKIHELAQRTSYVGTVQSRAIYWPATRRVNSNPNYAESSGWWFLVHFFDPIPGMMDQWVHILHDAWRHQKRHKGISGLLWGMILVFFPDSSSKKLRKHSASPGIWCHASSVNTMRRSVQDASFPYERICCALLPAVLEVHHGQAFNAQFFWKPTAFFAVAQTGPMQHGQQTMVIDLGLALFFTNSVQLAAAANQVLDGLKFRTAKRVNRHCFKLRADFGDLRVLSQAYQKRFHAMG